SPLFGSIRALGRGPASGGGPASGSKQGRQGAGARPYEVIGDEAFREGWGRANLCGDPRWSSSSGSSRVPGRRCRVIGEDWIGPGGEGLPCHEEYGIGRGVTGNNGGNTS